MPLTRPRTITILSVLVATTLALWTRPARAAEREEMTDLFLMGQFSSSDDTSATVDAQDLNIEFDNSLSIGFGIGRNINEHLNINGTVLIGNPDFIISNDFASMTTDATLVAPDINLDWNILDNDVTPFVTAGAGLMFHFFDDSDQTDFSFGAGAGVRWDISHDVFMKVWYRAKWFDFDQTQDLLLLHTLNVGVGIMR